MSKKGKKYVEEAVQPSMLGSTAGPIPSTKKLRKVKKKEKRVRKRDRLKKLTRRQIERLIAKAKKTWVSGNETLRDGKWDKTGDLEMMVDEHECTNCGADVAEDGYCEECQMCKECCECEE